jgi:hypothetical protein
LQKVQTNVFLAAKCIDTIQQQINCALKGKAWRIDVGMSRGVVSGTPEVLEVMMKDGTEIVSVLTFNRKIAAEERQIEELANMF